MPEELYIVKDNKYVVAKVSSSSYEYGHQLIEQIKQVDDESLYSILPYSEVKDLDFCPFPFSPDSK